MAAVLIVDDDQMIRAAFTKALRKAGFDVTAVPDGVAALHELPMYDFDVVICDFNMPQLGGQGFYEQIEEQFPNVAGRVVFVTGFGNDPKYREFFELTGQPVLSKPVPLEELVHAVRQLIIKNRNRPSLSG